MNKIQLRNVAFWDDWSGRRERRGEVWCLKYPGIMLTQHRSEYFSPTWVCTPSTYLLSTRIEYHCGAGSFFLLLLRMEQNFGISTLREIWYFIDIFSPFCRRVTIGEMEIEWDNSICDETGVKFADFSIVKGWKVLRYFVSLVLC